MREADRRSFLKRIMQAGSVVFLSPALSACGDDGAAPDEMVDALMAQDFRVEVEGMYEEVPDVLAFAPGAISVATEQGDDGTLSHGEASFGDLSVMMRDGPELSDMHDWVDEAMELADGADDSATRKNLVLYLLDADGEVARTIRFVDALPVDLGEADGDMTMSCAVRGIEVS